MLRPGVTKAVLIVHGNCCQYCGGVAVEADHIIPSRMGGTDKEENLIASCRRCNATKGKKPLSPEYQKKMLLMAFALAPLVRDITYNYVTSRNDAKRTRAVFVPELERLA